jgi:hypothetical protein
MRCSFGPPVSPAAVAACTCASNAPGRSPSRLRRSLWVAQGAQGARVTGNVEDGLAIGWYLDQNAIPVRRRCLTRPRWRSGNTWKVAVKVANGNFIG